MLKSETLITTGRVCVSESGVMLVHVALCDGCVRGVCVHMGLLNTENCNHGVGLKTGL